MTVSVCFRFITVQGTVLLTKMRTYKRELGARSYRSYTPETLQKAVSQYKRGKLTMRKASRKYGIPFGSLFNAIHQKHTGVTGGQLRLTAEAENRLIETIDLLSTWKIPMTGIDIKLLVKDYLDHSGVQDSRFKNNCPGDDWLKSFISRHKLTQRLADNVKPARAEVDAAKVHCYFDELERTLAGVPPENIFNYDETNVTDNPGAKTVVCRRGLKRVERKIHHSKSSVSIMYCGNAAGTYLPPMVIYKALNYYTEWTKGGPNGSIYDATKSGWFDGRCFEQWFSEILVPHVQGQPGTKVVIGDNLASHFTLSVVQLANDNNIRFVCLLPNATHLLQPLDVAVFRPLKINWRNILETWRKESRVKGTIPKNQFPGMLLKLQNQLNPANLTAGFKASGICPVDREMVLKRLPTSNQDKGGASVNETFNAAIADILAKHCGQGVKKKQSRGTKITPGKPVLPSDIPVPVCVPVASGSGQCTSHGKSSRSARPPSKRAKVVDPVDSSDDSSSTDVEPSSDDTDAESHNEDSHSDDAAATGMDPGMNPGCWVVVAYPGKKKNSSLKYIGQIMTVKKRSQEVEVKFVKKQPGESVFKFPEADDIDDVPISYIVEFVAEPIMNNRNQFTFQNLKNNVMR